jgi:hypothetical protein
MDRASASVTLSSATPMALLASSTSPIAWLRGWSLAIRDPSASPVSPPSPVRV